jgi:hypothetical protein
MKWALAAWPATLFSLMSRVVNAPRLMLGHRFGRVDGGSCGNGIA